MREIKFRAWDIENRIMLLGVQDMHDNLGRSGDQACWRVDSFGGFLDDYSFHVMQYTGLKDKNGVEIYEGDIVKDAYSRRVVSYEVGEWIPFAYSGGGEMYPARCEVIGNIYEKPEMTPELV